MTGSGGGRSSRADPAVTLGPARWQDFPGSSRLVADPGYTEFLGDLARVHGLELHPGRGGHTYGEMLASLIGDLVPPDQPADALILGFTMPDLSPGRATATYLSHVCPGNPMAFAVCDQGCAAGFTALRLTRDYAADSGCRRVLVALAEQRQLDYDPPAPASVPAGNAAFAMLCDTVPAAAGERQAGGGAPLLRAVRVLPGVPAGQVPAILGRELGALPETEPPRPGEEQRTLVLGEGLASLARDGAPGWRSRATLPGHPMTGAWRELAAWVTAPGGGCFAMADYDSALGYLCLAVFAKVA